MDTSPDLRSGATRTGPTLPGVQPGGLDDPGPDDALETAVHDGRAVSPIPGGEGVDRVQEGPGGNLLGARLDSESLRETFQDLPEPWREVLWHMDLNNVPAHEAARLLGLSLPGVKGLHRRATVGFLERLSQLTQQPDHPGAGIP